MRTLAGSAGTARPGQVQPRRLVVATDPPAVHAWGQLTPSGQRLWSLFTWFYNRNVYRCPGTSPRPSRRCMFLRLTRGPSPSTLMPLWPRLVRGPGVTMSTPRTLRAGRPNQSDTVARGAAQHQASGTLGVAVLSPRAFQGSVACPGSRAPSPENTLPAGCACPAEGAGFPGREVPAGVSSCLPFASHSTLSVRIDFFFQSEVIYLESQG